MRSSLVIRGGPYVPNGDIAKANSITEFVFEADDPALRNDPAKAIKLFADLRVAGYKIRVMRDVGWPSSAGGPLAVAKALSDDIKFYGGGAEGQPATAQLSAMYDGEVPHDSAFHLLVINEFFRRRSGRSLVWTLEGLQGGWISPELVQKINDTPLLYVAPQCYYGNMTPIFVEYVIEDLVARGIERPKIQPFLRADRLDAGWYGINYDHSAIKP